MATFFLAWFLGGMAFSVPLHYVLPSIRGKVAKMQPENKAAATLVERTLEVAVIAAGLGLSIYGSYLAAKAGEGKVSQEEFTNLANQLQLWYTLYFGVILGFIGVAVGTVLVLATKNLWQHFTRKDEQTTTSPEIGQDVLVSPKELKATITKIQKYKKAKEDLDDFLTTIQENEPKG